MLILQFSNNKYDYYQSYVNLLYKKKKKNYKFIYYIKKKI